MSKKCIFIVVALAIVFSLLACRTSPEKITPTSTLASNSVVSPLAPAKILDIHDSLLIVSAKGANSLTKINVHVESSSPEKTMVRIPSGTIFKPKQSKVQAMVTTASVETTLSSIGSQSRDIPAFCIEMEKDMPTSGDILYLSDSGADGDLKTLIESEIFQGKVDQKLKQYAVWTITDNPEGYSAITQNPNWLALGPNNLEIDNIRKMFRAIGISTGKYQALRFGDLIGVWGSSPSDVFAIEQAYIIDHYDGKDWTKMFDSRNYFLGIWGSSASDVFAVGDNDTILHYDGKVWKIMNTGTTHQAFNDIWGTSSSDVFAVGWNGIILHYNGEAWSQIDSGTTYRLKKIWGISGEDIFAFAVANMSTAFKILHYDGHNWSEVVNITSELNDIWGTSNSNLFAVGQEARIVEHYDGKVWSEMESGATNPEQCLQALWGSSGTDVFAVGWKGTIVHYDGKVWSEMDSGTTENLEDIWGSSPSDVFAVGDNGTILHYNGKAWSKMD
jgi:photosystem II stability/assembly factor-like uncharacterized protein